MGAALEAILIRGLENWGERQAVFVAVAYKVVGLLKCQFPHLWNRKWMVIPVLLWLGAMVGSSKSHAGKSYRAWGLCRGLSRVWWPWSSGCRGSPRLWSHAFFLGASYVPLHIPLPTDHSSDLLRVSHRILEVPGLTLPFGFNSVFCGLMEV